MAGGNKIFWSTTCPSGEHGMKEAGSGNAKIVKVAMPKAHKPSKHRGCPGCQTKGKSENA